MDEKEALELMDSYVSKLALNRGQHIELVNAKMILMKALDELGVLREKINKLEDELEK